MIIKCTEGLGNKKTGGNHSDFYVIENGQNTMKIHANLRGLIVTHSSERPLAKTDMKNTQTVNK